MKVTITLKDGRILPGIFLYGQVQVQGNVFDARNLFAEVSNTYRSGIRRITGEM